MKKRIKKRNLIGITLALSMLTFVFPFMIREESESYLTVLSVSLSAISTVATFITLIIAFQLYDRFGLQSRFIGNQTDKVLELVDFLKGKYLHASTGKLTYFIGTNRDKITMIKETPFKNDKNKILIINHEDFSQNWSDKLSEIKRSYWLPRKIKKKIEALEFIFTYKIDDPTDEKYIKIYFKKFEGDWYVFNPQMTFEDFLNRLDNLTKSVEKWLKYHSDIKIDYNLGEPESFSK